MYASARFRKNDNSPDTTIVLGISALQAFLLLSSQFTLTLETNRSAVTETSARNRDSRAIPLSGRKLLSQPDTTKTVVRRRISTAPAWPSPPPPLILRWLRARRLTAPSPDLIRAIEHSSRAEWRPRISTLPLWQRTPEPL